MSRPVILLGAGGHARVLLDILMLNDVEILGYTSPDGTAADLDIQHLGDDEIVADYSADEIELVNGVGDQAIRQKVYVRFKARGYSFSQVIHPAAVISTKASLAEGVQIMAGAVVQTGTKLGENLIINTHASVDHDCIIGRHSHIAVGAALAGNIHIGHVVLIGAGAAVIQGIEIGDGSVVGAGAVVVRNVPAGKTVVGVPAKEII